MLFKEMILSLSWAVYFNGRHKHARAKPYTGRKVVTVREKKFIYDNVWILSLYDHMYDQFLFLLVYTHKSTRVE